MKLKKQMISIVVFAILMVTIHTQIDFSETQKNIVIINSYHHGLSWTDDSTKAEIETIKSGYPHDVKFYVEYMDWKEHPTEQNLILFEELLANKYKDMTIDLIIASDDAAFDFILKHRENLFGDVPLIFHGISEASYASLVTDETNLTGVLEIVNIKTTLEIAKMVNPDLETIYIIYDETESGRAMGKAAAEEVHLTLEGAQVIEVTDLSIEEIVTLVLSLDSKDSILMTAYYTDVNGKNIDFEDMIEKVSKATSAPVFSLYDFSLGTGALGGNLLSGRLIGTRAGELAIEILNGAKADELELVRDNIHINAIDYAAAVEFGIDFDRLTTDVEIINEPISVFETYRNLILTVILIIIGMVAFLIILSYYLNKTLELKNQLADKNVELKHLNDEVVASEEELKAQFDALTELFDELQASKEKNELILDAIKDAIIDWNIKEGTVSTSAGWEALFGFPPEQFNNSHFMFDWVHEEDLELISPYYKLEFGTDVKNFLIEMRLRTKDDVFKWFLVKGVVARDINGTPTRIISSFTDIDAIIRMEDQIRHAAFHDEMTGYPNKNALEKLVSTDLKNGMIQYGIMLIDIDRFKRINDTMGHRFGDKYIKKVGAIIKDNLLPDSNIFRMGGDEFVVYHRMHQLQELEQLSETLIHKLNSVIQVEYSNFSNSISIGTAVYPHDGDTLESLLTRADLAMYSAKENGRGRVARYDNTLFERIVWRIEREEALKMAMGNGELSLVYQPQVSCETNEIVGFEALIRWYNPKLGYVSPLEFIPIAEETQLIMPIGQWVIDESLDFLSKANARYGKSYHMAVNVSVLQLIQEDFETIIEQALEKHHISGDQFVIEITESVIIQTIDTASVKLERLQNRGIKVALDDFGTGYSSLSYLKTLPIDILKIDKSFIDEMANNKSQEDLVQLIIQLGRQLEMTLIAEGVESTEQMNLLQKMNCDYLQGYYYSKPLSGLDCMKLLEMS
jgi:diguanylate cyclase (GGDEF)-like protein/PAS domain S-box-containing protein